MKRPWRALNPLFAALLLTGLSVGAVGCSAADDRVDSVEQGVAGLAFDAANYEDRSKIVLLLEERHPYPEGWEDMREGLRVLTDWQRASGRAQHEWWQNCNRALDVWPLQILQKYRGEFQDVTLANVEGADWEIPEEVARSVLAYYDELARLRAAVDAGVLSGEEAKRAEGKLQALEWEWHQVALGTALARGRGAMERMPKGEQIFARSWGEGMVSVMSALNSSTSFEIVSWFVANALPERLVEEADYDLRRSSSLAHAKRTALVSLRSIEAIERKSGGRFSRLLARLNRNDQAFDLSVLFQEALTKGSGAPAFFLREAAKELGEDAVRDLRGLLGSIDDVFLGFLRELF